MRPITREIPETTRAKAALAFMIIGWTGAATIVALIYGDVLDNHRPGLLPLVGLAVAATLVRSRMRLTETITQVFQAGLTTSVALQTNVVSTACIIETDLEGRIRAVEHPEVIGWPDGELIARSFEDIVPDRFLRLHLATFKQFRDSTEVRTAGVTLNIPIVREDGEEAPTRMTIARLGDALVSTLVPAAARIGENENPSKQITSASEAETPAPGVPRDRKKTNA